jgi:hypothetical protein
MFNQVTLSGTIQVIHDLEGTKLAVIKCNNELFYVYWDDNEYYFDKLVNKYVCINGYLQHIKYKLKQNKNTLSILAVCVEEMEECEV